MDTAFHSSFCNVLIRGYLCSPTDKKNVDDALDTTSIMVQFGVSEIHELAIKNSVDSMYPTGELVFRTSKVDTMSKILLQQISFLKLEIETSHYEQGKKKVDIGEEAYYVVSQISEDTELEDEHETQNGRDRFYRICFDSSRKLNLHGNCIYSSYKDDSSGDMIPEILKKLFADVGIKLKIDYATDKHRIGFITSHNATVRTSFQYLMRRMYDGYKVDDVDIPFLSYDSFGNNYQLISLNGLEKREKDKNDEISGIAYGDAWLFHVVANHENAAMASDTDSTYFCIESGDENKNDVIKSFYNRTRTDYESEPDEFTEGKKVEMDHLVKKLLVMNPPKNDIDALTGSNFKMVPTKQFLDVIDKDFDRNKDVFAATCRSTTFRDNVFTSDYLSPLLFGSDRLCLDTPGNMVRTLGDMVTVRTDNDPNNAYNINKFQGKYIIVDITHRFFRDEKGKMLYRDVIELVMSSTTKSEINVA